jgi:hypothetical protein
LLSLRQKADGRCRVNRTCRAISPSFNGASIAAPVLPTWSISFFPQPSRRCPGLTASSRSRTQLGNQAHVRGYGLHHGRAAVRKNDRCYADYGRLSRPRGAVVGKRPPYVELAITVTAFLFVLFIVFGGASPPEPEVASMGTERP